MARLLPAAAHAHLIYSGRVSRDDSTGGLETSTIRSHLVLFRPIPCAVSNCSVESRTPCFPLRNQGRLPDRQVQETIRGALTAMSDSL